MSHIQRILVNYYENSKKLFFTDYYFIHYFDETYGGSADWSSVYR